MQSKDVNFRPEWHWVRNRAFSTRESINIKLDVAEIGVLSRKVWDLLNPRNIGVAALPERLSRVLQDQILTHLSRVFHNFSWGLLITIEL